MANRSSLNRNTEGLKRHAAEKRAATGRKVDDAIDELKAAGKKITVTAVAKLAGVSRSTIYSNWLDMERIRSLQALAMSPAPAKLPKSERQRKDEKIADLRNRIAKLESDKEKLLAQLVEMELLRQENEILKARLARRSNR